MQVNTNYHIDVTPEEQELFKEENAIMEKPNKPKAYSKATFLRIFCIVFGVHLAAAAIMASSLISANAANAIEDKKFVGQEPSSPSSNVGNFTTTPVSSTKPTATDWPAATASPVVTYPTIKPKPAIPTTQKPNSVKYTTQYIVKQGDTLISISKKYKLNVNRLLKINNIKDPTKLKVGQVLKFM
jgi:LysM repeat protein